MRNVLLIFAAEIVGGKVGDGVVDPLRVFLCAFFIP